MIISRTPFRVSFFGGGTDFPDFFKEHGGATLLTTIDKYCYLSIHRLSPFFKYRFRASYARTELVQDPKEFQHPLIRECLTFLEIKDGLEVTHVSDLPGRTGLGTSSAFTVGLLHALHAFMAHRVTAEDLAQEAIVVERQRVGDVGGYQDQYAAAYGGFIRLDFSHAQQVSIKQLAVSTHRINELEKRLLLFYTGVEQPADKVLSEQRRRIGDNTQALLDMLDMVDEAEQVITSGGDLKAFGDLLHQSWQLKKGLSKGISNSTVDQAYDAARRAGARGGKLLGAGGRGFLLVYAEPDHHVAVRESLSALKPVPLTFSDHGSEIIFTAPSS